MARATVAAGPAKRVAARKPAVSKTELAGPRLLHSLCAQNLLSFGPDASPLELGSLNVLIGPNGSGKSNLLDAVALLRSSAQELRSEILRGGGILEWIWKGRPKGPASLIAEVTSPSAKETLRHGLFLGEEAQSFALYEEEILRRGPKGQSRLLYHWLPGKPVKILGSQGPQELSSNTIDPTLSVLTQRRDPEGFPEITFLADAYSKIRVYRDWVLGRSAGLRQPQRTDMRSDRLEEDFSNLGLVLSRLGRKPKAKMDILTRLRDLYEGITSFDLSVEGGTVQVFFTEGDFTIPASRLSDGTLRYLSLLAILCDPQPPPLVCLEEPELGLHPDLIPKVADLLIEASQRMQLIVTTHSDILVDALTERPESVVICEKHDGKTEMLRLDRAELSVWLQNYRLGELWTRGHLGGQSLVSAEIFLEGGGDSKELQSRCRAGFRRLLEACGFAGRMPALVACGGRTAAFRDFGTQHGKAQVGSFVGLLVDSEDPVDDTEKPWKHLVARDGKSVKPKGAQDEQVFLMTTCMETWIVCDRATLKGHYGANLQESAFPPLIDLEKRERAEVQRALERATRKCSNAYAKGQRSFAVLGKLDPDALAQHLPSFARMRLILEGKLRS